MMSVSMSHLLVDVQSLTPVFDFKYLNDVDVLDDGFAQSIAPRNVASTVCSTFVPWKYGYLVQGKVNCYVDWL